MIAAVVCLLAFDSGTPFLPGAFQFGADGSIETSRDRPARAHLTLPSPDADRLQRAASAVFDDPRPKRATTTPARRPQPVRLFRRADERTPASQSPDDH